MSLSSDFPSPFIAVASIAFAAWSWLWNSAGQGQPSLLPSHAATCGEELSAVRRLEGDLDWWRRVVQLLLLALALLALLLLILVVAVADGSWLIFRLVRRLVRGPHLDAEEAELQAWKATKRGVKASSASGHGTLAITR